MLYSAIETTVSVPDSLLVVLITTLIAWDVLTDINGYHYTDQLTYWDVLKNEPISTQLSYLNVKWISLYRSTHLLGCINE